jgi:glycosyltransferase involved in cell wall biosynthesis
LISAIIPARNEEATLARAVESVAAQPEAGEIIVVNDQSIDQTAAILADLAARIPKLRVLNTNDLPAGWTGKNHAVWLGAKAARGDWLLFTDADTYHLPGAAARALALAAEHDAVLVSFSPEQEMGSFWERSVIPLVYWRLSQRYSLNRVNDPKLPDAAANGQYLMIRREAYTAAGGHEAIAAEILEDVALARNVKQRGYKIFFAPGNGMVRTRMYRSLGAMWQGWTKNLYPLFGGSFSEMAMEIDAASPWLGVLFALVFGWELLRGIRTDWLLAVVAGILFVRPWAWYEGWLRRNRYPASYIQYYLPGVSFYTAALIASWWKHTRGKVAWKGREYARAVPGKR